MRTNRNLGLNKQAKKIHDNSTVEDTVEELGFSFNSVESVREIFVNQFKAHGYDVNDTTNKYLGSNRYVEINNNYIKKAGELKLKNFVCFVHPNPKKEIAFGVGFSGTMTYYENEPGYIWIHGADNEAYLEGQGIQFRSRGSASVHHVDIDVLKAIFNLLSKFCNNPTNESSINLGLNNQAKKKHEENDAVDNIGVINFEDPEVERICNEHGVYTIADAAKVTSLRYEKDGYIVSWFKDSSIKTFDEFKYFTGIKYLYPLSFFGCKDLQRITLPNGIIDISNQAFRYCKSLESIIFPSSLKSIESGAFISSGLKSVTIHSNIKSIGMNAFYNCDNLTVVYIAEGLDKISDYAFENCKELKIINIPNSVTRIGEGIFSGCEKIEKLYISCRHPVRKELFSKVKLRKECKIIDPDKRLDEKINENSNLGLNKQAKKKFDFDSSLDKTIESMKELHTIEEAVDFIKMYAKAKGFNNIYEGYAFSSFNDDPAGKVYIRWDKEYQRVTLKVKTSSGPSISTLADYPTYIEVSFGHMFRRVDTPSNEDYIDYWNRTGNAFIKEHLPTSIIVWVFDEAKRVIEHNSQKVNESNLGLNKQAKKVFNNSVEDPLGEFNEEFLKSLVLSKIVYCITGDENKKELDDEGFGLQCDLDDGVAVDGKEKFGCRLYTINYKTTYIHSTIIADQDTCEFLFIHVWYIDVSIPNWGYEDSKSIKIYPDEIPEDVREWIEDNIVIE